MKGGVERSGDVLMARARARCLRCDLRLVGRRASFDGSRGGTRGTLLALLLREGVGCEEEEGE